MLSIFQRARLVQRFSVLSAASATDSITCPVTRQFNTSSTRGGWRDDDYNEYKLKRRADEQGARDPEGYKRSSGSYSPRERHAGPSDAGRGGGRRQPRYNNHIVIGSKSMYGSEQGRDGYRSSSGFGRQGDRHMESDGFFYPENIDTHGKSVKDRRRSDWSLSTPADPILEHKLFGKCQAPTSSLAPPADIKVTSTTGGTFPPVTTWEEMNLGETVTRNLSLMKLPAPTPVQSYAMPIIAEGGHNLLASAQTGSGKTAAFLAPTIAKMCRQGPPELLKNDSTSDVLPLVLILSPTRELCNQIFTEAQKLTYRSQIRPYVCYGGTNINQNITELRKGTELLVATPGRLKDLVDRGIVSLRCVQTLILDEADFMLDLGFSKAVDEICFGMDMGKDKRTLLFSATFPPDIMGLARNIMAGGGQSTVKIAIGRCGSTSDTIEQKFLTVNGAYQKKEPFLNLLKTMEQGTKTLVFVATKVMCNILTEDLKREGLRVEPINGDLTQNQRERALRRFKAGQTEIMVATEVAARGIDVPCIDQVINYDMPGTLDQYVHRIGRTGRVGRKGTAISFIDTQKDQKLINGLKDLLQETNQGIPDFMNRRGVYGR